ncbi:M48 family metallopeptidase [Massilia sp. YIM B02443]|uniref:M48 family metallopeptidase n=1 Tax=Massilia sp. YIM B02443 TaxID=3050127 RepID=UPI0025B68B77|nr:M48 family metallopeptidase [Massilia sp. YIM B02443]MDN4038761.1 M48 family metallopeptidase [Massilia sp. YIM B02443]
MSSLGFSVLFVFFLLLTLGLRLWLAMRHVRHVGRHRASVPAEFAPKVPLAAHQKAADYTIAKTRFGLAAMLWGAVTLVGFTLLGGLQWLSLTLVPHFGPGLPHQMALVVAFAVISGLLDLPFDWYRKFVLEQRFGFNKMTPGLWLSDQMKGALVGAVIGLPLLWVVLTLMEKSGDLWWLYTWFVWSGFQLLMIALYPSLIAPLFNKFTPLSDDSLKQRIEGLMQRVGFASRGLFVMDGSRRSAHGNAYFSGFGRAKRIVFFDTLLSRLEPQEIEAVLAHELGHFKLRHIVKRVSVMFAMSLAFLALLGYLKAQAWFYTGLGVLPFMNASNDGMALILFMLVLPIFTFVFAPLSSITSRKHEFEADAFAARHTDYRDLVSALVKMYEDNASTLTPDPLHSAFYDSHPPASVRVKHLTVAAA